MGRLMAALMLAVILISNPHTVRAQDPEAKLWQDTDTDRTQALQRMIIAAAKVCASPDQKVQPTQQAPQLERMFIAAVRPLIRSTLAGVYGHDMPFWMEKVSHVQSLKKYPDVMRTVVEVQTYEGTHNSYGIDAIEFQLVPGPHLFVRRVVSHRMHPDARQRR